MVLQKAMKQGRNVHGIHHVMHALTFLTTSRGVATLGRMPTPFLCSAPLPYSFACYCGCWIEQYRLA